MKWLDSLSDMQFVSGGVGVALATLLIVGAGLFLPKGERRRARFPALLLLLVIALHVLRAALPTGSEGRRPLELAALFLLLTAIGRAGFLVVVDWFVGQRLRRPVPRIFRDIIQVLVFFAVALITFRAMGAELGSLLTTSALLTAIVGFSLQETLGNLFAGLAIQAQRPFEIGDWIQVQGTPDDTVGRVVEINWRATRIETSDLVEIVVPNGILAKSPILNFTKPRPISRRKVSVQGAYEVPPHVAEAALLGAIRGSPGIIDDPAPATWVSAYADSGVEYTLVYFIDDYARRSAIDAEVRRRAWYALKRAGVSIPFPVRDVRVMRSVRTTPRELEEDALEDRARMLRRVDFMAVLPSDAVTRLARASAVRAFGPGEEIIRQGEEGSELFIIQRGEAAVFVSQGERPAIEVARLGPGGVFGEMSLITGERRSATVCAATACELVVVGHEPFREVLEAHPEVAQRISEILASRQAEIDMVNSSKDAYDRVTRSGMLLDRIRNFFSLWPR